MLYGESWRPPVDKPVVSQKILPVETVSALVEAAEKIQDKFQADTKLQDLYYDGYNRLLDVIGDNVTKKINPV
jgi:hypothetical protein